MRLLLVMVALFGTTWPQVAVMDCAVAPTAEHGHGASVVQEHAHDRAPCLGATACNSAMLEGNAVEAVAEAVTPPVARPAAVAAAPTLTVLTSDPPPPRRPA